MSKVIEVEPCFDCRKLIRVGEDHECAQSEQDYYDSLSEAQQWYYTPPPPLSKEDIDGL